MKIALILKSLIFPRNEFVFERTFLHDKIIFFVLDCFSDKVGLRIFDFWHLHDLITVEDYSDI